MDLKFTLRQIWLEKNIGESQLRKNRTFCLMKKCVIKYERWLVGVYTDF